MTDRSRLGWHHGLLSPVDSRHDGAVTCTESWMSGTRSTTVGTPRAHPTALQGAETVWPVPTGATASGRAGGIAEP